MHHFIYPSQDTFITNKTNYPNSNFGLDEILVVGTQVSETRVTLATKTFSYTSESVQNLCIPWFSGNITSGSLSGVSESITGSITGGTGSVSGVGFSGSGVLSGSNFSGSALGFNGIVVGFSGSLATGTITGDYIVSQSNQVVTDKKFVNRSLVKFDLATISESIAIGDIQNPNFKLKLKVARAENLPITYTIYAFPVSQSWVMGAGYLSDGGSSKGASWNFRNYYSGSVWYPLTASTSNTPIDFITAPSSASAVWPFGGGTWFTSSIASQSFNYQSGDIDMDVTSIVNQWLSGSIPNEGFILITSDEIQNSGSQMGLYFFSKDSNTIYQPCLDVGWSDFSWVTGSVSTSSVDIVTLPAGILGTVTAGATISGSSVNGGFNGTVNLNTTSSGAMIVSGFSGSINGMNIYGNISYSLSSSYTASSTSSFILGNLLDGYFSGSIFTASISSFVLTGGNITGSWNTSILVGSDVSASYPFPIDPSLFLKFTSRYFNGTALGTYITNSLTSGSFTGIMTDGPQVGAYIYAPFTGSFLTASYSYTSSVVMITSSLESVEFNIPFVTVVQNVPPTIKAGSIIRVNVFARPEFPFKNFQRRTQFIQYLTPQYLPTSSYYAIKDNETEQNVLNFDSYTQLSCDTNGNYFMLDTTGLPQERYFKILIKTEQSGSSYVFDNANIFKIVR